ncbi:MAG: hypothetical protein MZV64_63305 [Ignavibacteriales bacterium]|nr:hypothetical protein [Ignavibacteriales bacterium]
MHRTRRQNNSLALRCGLAQTRFGGFQGNFPRPASDRLNHGLMLAPTTPLGPFSAACYGRALAGDTLMHELPLGPLRARMHRPGSSRRRRWGRRPGCRRRASGVASPCRETDGDAVEHDDEVGLEGGAGEELAAAGGRVAEDGPGRRRPWPPGPMRGPARGRRRARGSRRRT